jgi:hypothetical protein
MWDSFTCTQCGWFVPEPVKIVNNDSVCDVYVCSITCFKKAEPGRVGSCNYSLPYESVCQDPKCSPFVNSHSDTTPTLSPEQLWGKKN